MNIRKLMKQAEEMQRQMQEQMAGLVVEASVGGGMVAVKMDGSKTVTEVRIDPEVLDPEDPAMVQDLVLAAFNQAASQIDEQLQSKLGGMAGGLGGLPGLG